MQRRIEYVQKIQEALAFISSRVQISKRMTDVNIISEDFLKQFLNFVYGYDLSNANTENANSKSIDLVDYDQGLAYQITSENNTKKIKKTVNGFIDDKKYETIQTLTIITLTHEKKCSNAALDKLDQYTTASSYLNLQDLETRITTEIDDYDLKPIVDFLEYSINSNLEMNREDNKDLKSEFGELHIIDQMFNVLNLFNGLNSLHPRTISKLFPFTLKDRYDSYRRYCLSTDNEEIHNVLSKIEVKNSELIILNPDLEPFRDKIISILEILNNSLVSCISFGEKREDIVHHKIWILGDRHNCQCHQCKYLRFDINTLRDEVTEKTIKHSEDSIQALSEAFYLYKLGEPVECWKILSELSNDNNEIIKFISRYNIRNLYSSINVYRHKNEAKHILPQIKEINLPKTIANSGLKRVVQNELSKIQCSGHLHESRRRIEESLIEITRLKKSYSKGYAFTMGPSYITNLVQELDILFSFHNTNNILIDDFVTFRTTIKKGISGIIKSYATNESLNDRYKEFKDFVLILIIEYLTSKDFITLIKEEGVEILYIKESDKHKILERAKSFFEFQYFKSFGGYHFNDKLEKQETFSRYKSSLNNKFENIVTILALGNFSNSEISEIIDPLLNTIEVANYLTRESWRRIVLMMNSKIDFLNESQILRLIELTIDSASHRSGEDELKNICNIASERIGFTIDSEVKLDKLITKATQPCIKCGCVHKKDSILSYWHIANSVSKEKIKAKLLEQLATKFNVRIFESMAFMNIINLEDENELVHKYVEVIQKRGIRKDIELKNGRWIYQDFTTINSLSCLSHLGYDLKKSTLNSIREKSEFYNWILDPTSFDYTKFHTGWLVDLCNLSFTHDRAKESEEVAKLVKEELLKEFNQGLSDYYVKHLI